jgi:GntR family transcriptional regulator
MPITSDEPYYRRIMRDIQGKIANGELKPGEKIPSTAELAKTYNCSAPTVKQAIARLQETGVLRGHQGLGVFVNRPPDGG